VTVIRSQIGMEFPMPRSAFSFERECFWDSHSGWL